MHTCTSGMCGLAHTRFADLHIRDLRKCNCFHVATTWRTRCNHVATTWRTRCNHVATTWKQLHIRKSRMCMSVNPRCTSANRVCASPQIPDVHVCTSANRVCASPQIPDVYACTSANRVCASPQIPDVYVHRRIQGGGGG